MEIFGIGPMELVLILIIALMIFGPDKLPEIGAKLGRSMREMRQATKQFSQEIDATRQAIEAPMEELRAPLAELTGPLQQAGETAAAIQQTLTNPGERLRESVMRNLMGTGSDAAAAPATEADVTPLPSIAPPALAVSEPLPQSDVTPLPSAAEADVAPLPFQYAQSALEAPVTASPVGEPPSHPADVEPLPSADAQPAPGASPEIALRDRAESE